MTDYDDNPTLDALPHEVSERILAALQLELAERDQALQDLTTQYPSYRQQIAAEVAALEQQTYDQVDIVAQRDDEEAIPEQIGRYKVLGFLGRGGMARVYLARQEEPLDREVAIKVLNKTIEDPDTIYRFKQECLTLARAEHPSIARVYDSGVTVKGNPFVVMERIVGRPIHRFCDEHQLEIADRIQLFRKVCSAVQYAHGKGVIHRDLKPSNVLVRDLDGEASPVILDFGLALAQGAQATPKEEQGKAIGTPGYMSPEQCLGRFSEIDARSDVYALGVLLYQILAGTTPFDSAELRRIGWEAMARRIYEEDPLPPSLRYDPKSSDSLDTASLRKLRPEKLRSHLSGDLDWITLRAMHKERDGRYSTPTELAEDLQRYLNHEPVQASPPSQLYRIRKYVRRHRVMLSSVTSIILVLSVLLAINVAERRRADLNAEKTRLALMAFERSNAAHIARGLELETEEELWPIRPDLTIRIPLWMRQQKALEKILERSESALDSWNRAAPPVAGIGRGGQVRGSSFRAVSSALGALEET
jgi:serine/threonine protein kinase